MARDAVDAVAVPFFAGEDRESAELGPDHELLAAGEDISLVVGRGRTGR